MQSELPSVDIIKARRPTRLTELTNVHNIVLIFEHSSLVIVDIQIVGCTEDGHDTGEAGSSCLSVHAVSCILSFMRSDDRKKVVLLEKGACRRIRKEERATPDVIVNEELRSSLLTKFLQRVGP